MSYRERMRFFAILVVLAGTARADVSADVTKSVAALVDGVSTGKPDLAGVELFITPGGRDPLPDHDALVDLQKLVGKGKLGNVTVVATKSGAWLYGELATKPDPIRITAVLALDGKAWKVRATHWSIATPNRPIPGCGMLSDEWYLAPSVAKALEAPVKAIFDALSGNTIANNTGAFAKLMSDDKAALAIGTAPKERFEGGAKIKSLFAKWTLLDPARDPENHDPLPARANLAGDLAWIMMPVGAPSQMCTTYRALFVLAKEPAGWRIVHQHYAERAH